MNKTNLTLIITLSVVVLLSGCINQTITFPQENQTVTETNQTSNETQPPITDPCLNVNCPDSFRICPDGFKATCPNTCVDGSCSVCTPDCSEHQKEGEPPEDLCAGVKCNDSVKICPDGFEVSCSNTCNPETGTCSTCTPDCSDHQLEVCEESWSCSDWSSCVDNQQTRECVDDNSCGTTDNKPPETQSCETQPLSAAPDHVLISEVYYDAAGTPEITGSEWIELFNPTKNPIDISGYTINDNSRSWTIPDNSTVMAGGYFTLIKNESEFYSVFGCTFDTAYVSGMTLGLNNNGDYLILKNPSGEEADFVAWEKGDENQYPDWTVKADDDKSIKRQPINSDTDSLSDWIGDQTPYTQYCYR